MTEEILETLKEVELKNEIRERFGDDKDPSKSDLDWLKYACRKYLGIPSNLIDREIKKMYKRRLIALAKDFELPIDYVREKVLAVYPELEPYL